jgi:ABC-2 type transport system ATP-binding protein
MHISIQDLTVVYPGGTRALNGISLDLDKGTLGLLGPNGAGKSTMMKVLATLLEPTSGRVVADGVDVLADRAFVRERLGYLPQEFGAWRKLKAWELVDLSARLHGLRGEALRKAVDEALERTGLAAVRDRKARKLSGGMVRRLGIAAAIASRPELLIVDEPTTGLDPEERIRFRQLLQEIGGGATVILSTHIVADLAGTCENLVVLDKGNLLYRGRPEDLLQRARGKTWEWEVPAGKAAEASEGRPVLSTSVRGERAVLRTVGERPPGEGVREVEPTLEDAYVRLLASEGSGWPDEEAAALLAEREAVAAVTGPGGEAEAGGEV